jgi:hypothetical protein
MKSWVEAEVTISHSRLKHEWLFSPQKKKSFHYESYHITRQASSPSQNPPKYDGNSVRSANSRHLFDLLVTKSTWQPHYETDSNCRTCEVRTDPTSITQVKVLMSLKATISLREHVWSFSPFWISSTVCSVDTAQKNRQNISNLISPVIQFRTAVNLQGQTRVTFCTHRLWRSRHSHRSGTRTGRRNSCHSRSCRPWSRTACPPERRDICYRGSRLRASACLCRTGPGTKVSFKAPVSCGQRRLRTQRHDNWCETLPHDEEFRYVICSG